MYSQDQLKKQHRNRKLHFIERPKSARHVYTHLTYLQCCVLSLQSPSLYPDPPVRGDKRVIETVSLFETECGYISHTVYLHICKYIQTLNVFLEHIDNVKYNSSSDTHICTQLDHFLSASVITSLTSFLHVKAAKPFVHAHTRTYSTPPPVISSDGNC